MGNAEEHETIRVGLVGYGNMGRSHAKRILEGEIPGMRLTAVCDENPGEKSLPEGVSFHPDDTSLIESGEVDAVIIATPHYSHTDIGIRSLQAGLHTLVEKPISVHKADCQKLIAAHKDDSVVFSAMFNQRTDPKYQKVREWIESGELGAIRRVQWTITNWFRTEFYYASGGWRATWAGEGGGVLLNQCPHQLDLWQWLFGMPDRVRAFIGIGKYHAIEVEDDVTAYMEYDNGCTGVFITTTGEAPGTNRLEIAADNGRLTVEGNAIRWTRNRTPVSEVLRTAESGFGKPETEETELNDMGNGEQHAGILKNFADAILSGAPLIAPAKEGIRSVELGNAMLQSGLEERTVPLPVDAGQFEALLKKKIETSTFEKKVIEGAKPSDDDFAQSY